MVDMLATISAVSGSELELDLPNRGIPDRVNPDTKHPVCISPFEVNMYDGTMVLNTDGTTTISGGEWRLNPMFVKNWRSIFMDARGSRLVIDRTPIQELPV